MSAINGNMPKEFQDRLICATVSNMVSLAYLPPFNRKPTKEEFLEMAKSLVHVYPCLNDSEKKHLSIFSNFLKSAHTHKQAGLVSKLISSTMPICHTQFSEALFKMTSTDHIYVSGSYSISS